MTDFTDRVILRLNGSLPVIQSPIDAVKKIWWFQDGKWAPQGFSDHGSSYLTLTNYNNNPPDTPLNLFAYTIQGTGGEPVLTIDRGFTVQKDITAGGFVGSNKGELWLGSGRNDQVDVPKIILFHSDVSRLQGGGSFGVPGIPSGIQFPAGEKGQLFIFTPTSYLYKHDGNNWVSMGPTSNYAGYFDTLYLEKLNGDPAHLDVGNVSVHGHLGVGDTVTSDLNPNPGLHLGNYNNPWQYVDTTYLFTNQINCLSDPGVKMPPIVPYTSGYCNGNWANDWDFVTGQILYYKSLSNYYCAKELSDTPVERKIKTVEEAVASLKHEVTKDVRHINYGEKDGTIKCICGKEATEPCPEHLDEWRDKYTVNTGNVIDSAAVIVLNLLERMENLERKGVSA